MISDATPLAANAHLTFILESCFTCAREWDFSDYKWMVKCLCACFVTGCSCIVVFLNIFYACEIYSNSPFDLCIFFSASMCLCECTFHCRTPPSELGRICSGCVVQACVWKHAWKFVCKLCMSQFEKCLFMCQSALKFYVWSMCVNLL